MEEEIEVVNKDGKVIGVEKRNIVHEKGLWHKSIFLLLFDEEGRIFIQKRADSKATIASKWDLSVSGLLKPGEGYEDAAKREVEEELGVKAKDLKKIGNINFHYDYGDGRIDNELARIFTSRFEGEIKLDREEASEGKWVKKEQLMEELGKKPGKFTPWAREVFKWYEKQY